MQRSYVTQENIHTSISDFYSYDDFDQRTLTNYPLLIHMMYMPWGKDQTFISEEFNFDHTSYFNMLERARTLPQAKVILWTKSRLKEFCIKFYPEVWNTLENYSSRSVMYVDILRWLVVYHFGGIYWQYNSLSRAASMDVFLPGVIGRVRLFTETLITPEFAHKMRLEPIRQGQPEELVRVATQVFSVRGQKNETIGKVLSFLLNRMMKLKAKSDYDILYITGNAALSEYYDQFGKHDVNLELVPLEQTVNLIDWNSQGSWRTDRFNSQQTH